ncbi:hypothetical protein CORC01_08218 [Colletotrichum orchidophilum]|uniref:Proteophosphoglycan ppg4 n=1 Tax=Colletotrichum orchidophilum TaxID=1209926 RepID=A0A1G4B580_9PEZI|nr:uncharacterized protein CORC01_08218 [Colletotrichum orchidophilum]OHE96455.1 hypothetical protein CORC01_08218 [Colletotrichum orchidophilum]
MGNAQSTESLHDSHVQGGSSSKKSPHKLSKPRVGNHASPTPQLPTPSQLSIHRAASASLPPSRSNSRLLPQQTSPAPSPISAPSGSQFGAIGRAPSTSSMAEPEVKPARDWKRRASLFRSKSSLEPRKQNRRESMLLSPPVPDRMSRANSMTWESQQEMDTSRQLQVESWHVPGNRQSINYNLMSYESRRLLNLNEDITACEENSMVSESKFEVSPNTWKSSHPHQPSVAQSFSTQLPRANSDLALYAPVRRRSMIQTPGLATRMPSEYPSSRRSSVRHSMPTTPAGGRSRMNSLSIDSSAYPIPTLEEYVAERFASEPEYLCEPVVEPVERALTPSDMDYRPLGAMKFGSLRITNGEASPLPSPDFEPAFQPGMMEQSQMVAIEEYFSHENGSGGVGFESKDIEITVSAVQSSVISQTLSPIKTSVPRAESQRRRSTSPPSPELKISSKHTAMEDDLFAEEDEDVQMEYSAEVLTVRNDPNAKPSLERLKADQSQKHSRAILRADSGVVASPTTEHQPKPLSKADSGYSSNVSLRSFHVKQRSAGSRPTGRTASEDSADELSDSIASPIAAVSSDSQQVSPIKAGNRTVDPSQARPSVTTPMSPKDYFLASPTSNTMMITSPKFFFNLSAGHSFRKDRTPPASNSSAQAAEKGPASPEVIGSPGASSEKPHSSLSIGSGLQKAGKLQRFLSGSGMRGPPAVHATHPSDEEIPSVPQDVQSKLEEHSGRFPITTKRLTLRAQASKETLKTIFSVGSFDATHASDKRGSVLLADTTQVARETIVETPGPSEKPKSPYRRSFQTMPASFPQAAASVMPRRPIHRKPVPSSGVGKAELVGESRADEIQVGFESSITAIDNVGGSVGKSAFDQAFMALPHEQPVQGQHSRTLTMPAQMEREIGMRFRPTEPLPPTSRHSDPASQNLQVSEMSVKRKTSPPVSLHTRSGTKSPRKPIPVRPQSSSSSEANRRQILSRQNSRETIHSYPSTSTGGAFDAPLSVPPIPPMSPRRGMTMLEQQYARRRLTVEDKWRPTNGSFPEFGHPVTRSASTNPTEHQQQRQLRHRSSYDSYSQYRGPVARGHSATSQNPSQSGSYYQQQLLNIQQQQWEQQQDYPPNAVQPGLSRSRSRSRSVHANGDQPYRVLHSYNSPAYRNAPIWG